MSARFCSSCGASLPAGAQFCTYCGAAVSAPPVPPGAAAAPAPPLPPRPPLPSAYAAPPPPAPPPRRSRARLVLIVFVVLILVVGVVVVALAFFPVSSDQVDLEGINIWAPDNVCGLNANPIGFTGFNGAPGDVDQLELSIPNFNATACTLAGMTTNTTGFTLSNVTLPLTIPGSSNPGNPVGENLNLTLTLPNTSFDGIVNLVVR